MIDDLIKEFNKINRHVYALFSLIEVIVVEGSLCSRMVTDIAICCHEKVRFCLLPHNLVKPFNYLGRFFRAGFGDLLADALYGESSVLADLDP